MAPSRPEDRLPVFVYGTLRPGEKNFPPFLAGRILSAAPARVAGRLYWVADGGYPYLLPEEGTVGGELIELDPRRYDEVLAELDRLEEYDPGDEAGSVYLRRRVEAKRPDGTAAIAWVYYWNRSPTAGQPVPGGDFKALPRRGEETSE